MTDLTTYKTLLRNFDQIVADQSATLASSLSANSANFDTLNLTPGSPLLALMEANAGLVLYLQWMNYKVLTSTRMSTSIGADLDSFAADFLFARYPAIPSTGQVICTRATANNTIYIPNGALLRTTDGSQSFTVISPSADPLNIYDPALGYRMDPNVYSVSVLVQAVSPGTIGNIGANSLKLQTSLPLSTVNNPSSFFNGQDAESDAQFISRFRLYINSLSRATPSAIENAIINTNPQYTYTLLENYISVDQPQPGCVLVCFDNGNGIGLLAPADQARLVSELQKNINEVRPAAVQVFVQPASAIAVQISMQATFASTNIRLTSVGQIQTAVANYINSLGVGQTLYLTKLIAVIYAATPNLLDVFNLVIQGIDQHRKFVVKSIYGDIPVNSAQVLRYIPNPPLVNGVQSIVASSIVIDY